MKIKNIISLLLLLFLFSCSDNKDKTLPKVSIPPETMINILTDISKAERMTMDNNLNKAERQQLLQSYKSSILKHYGVSREDYDKDLQTYLDNPHLMQTITKQL